MIRFAEFVRKNYQTIIIVTVIVGLLLGLWTTALGQALHFRGNWCQTPSAG